VLFVSAVVIYCVVSWFHHSKHGSDAPWTMDTTASAVKGWVGATALLAFVLGASAAGAEWAARTVQALLFWEPRRVRVIGAKVLALASVVVAIAVAAQLVLLAGTAVLTSARGSTQTSTEHVWSHIVATQGRGIALAVLAAVASFSISSLTRNTGASLGVAFVYLVILEQLLMAWKPVLAAYLLTPNVAAVVNGGIDFTSGDGTVVISAIRGALVLALYAAALLTAATTLFVRRDVT
jgi:ABC-type transport system involved in multi-copper enzyme maturation permease subunit